MPTQDEVAEAIRGSWTRETSSVPYEWSPANPARGQCDVTSFVFWEHFAGSLVLAEVFVDGERTEHHYWNRIDGADVDLTLEQFNGNEQIREKDVLPSAILEERAPAMREELRERIAVLRASVRSRLHT